MNGPNMDAIRRRITEAAKEHGPMRPESKPLTPHEQRERRLADALLGRVVKPEEVA